MYEDFYQLTGRPFQLTPDPRFYFDSKTHRKAMAYLTYGLNQGEGFIIVTGDIGAGKTTLVGHLFDELDKDEFYFAKVVTTQLDADNILRMVAGAFGLPTEKADKATLLQRIESFLRGQQRSGRRVLLIVDEAQNLPISALEELRMLSNYQQGDRALLQSFLLGQPEFRDALATSDELEQLRQRVIATHHLEPMDVDEVSAYIEHRLERVGWKDDPNFTPGAYRAIYDFTGGVPRRLNTLCSRILLFGALEEVHRIDEQVVASVISDLEKDNTPTTGPKHISSVDLPTSQTGPIAATGADLPAKALSKVKAAVHTNGAGSADDVQEHAERLAVLERYVKAHDATLRKMVDILSHWAGRDEMRDGS